MPNLPKLNSGRPKYTVETVKAFYIQAYRVQPAELAAKWAKFCLGVTGRPLSQGPLTQDELHKLNSIINHYCQRQQSFSYDTVSIVQELDLGQHTLFIMSDRSIDLLANDEQTPYLADNGLSLDSDETYRLYGNVCVCCGAKGRLTVDHVIPLCLGGSNTIDNIQPLCRSCNPSKGIKIIDYRTRFCASEEASEGMEVPIKIYATKEQLAGLTSFLCNALSAERLDIKQWYIWRIAESLGVNLSYFDADKGVAPSVLEIESL